MILQLSTRVTYVAWTEKLETFDQWRLGPVIDKLVASRHSLKCRGEIYHLVPENFGRDRASAWLGCTCSPWWRLKLWLKIGRPER